MTYSTDMNIETLVKDHVHCLFCYESLVVHWENRQAWGMGMLLEHPSSFQGSLTIKCKIRLDSTLLSLHRVQVLGQ